MNERFHQFARSTACIAGSPWAFLGATGCIVVWAITGPLLDFSNEWQLVANTVTTLITFVMVFIIQHTQNHDTAALHLKLDNLTAALDKASNWMIGVEDMSEEEVRQWHDKLQQKRGD